MTITITSDQARRLVLYLQGLADPPRRRMSSDSLLALIECLGYVQVDSISTVARAHHMILFARNRTYRPELLHRLLENERRLFEHWAHDVAAILPMRFYPYWQIRFERDRAAVEQRFRRWHGGAHQDELERVLAHVRALGPVKARDLVQQRPRVAGGWWDWHDGKAALEFLWRTGRLAIARREGFEKVYDLAERVIPEDARRSRVTREDFVGWACRAALERLGLATPGEIARFFGLVTIEEARAWCLRHLGGAVLSADVGSMDGAAPRRVFARPDIAALLETVGDPPRRLRALSPFDPVLRDRARVARLFGFDYRIEVFVPAPRRRYGYYVFPLLDGDRLIGRIDMKADRKSGALAVDALWMEPGCRLTPGRRTRLAAELERIRRFVGLHEVRFADAWLRSPDSIDAPFTGTRVRRSS